MGNRPLDIYDTENKRQTHRCKFEAEGVGQDRGNNITTLELRCSECGHRGTFQFNAHLISDDVLAKLMQ